MTDLCKIPYKSLLDSNVESAWSPREENPSLKIEIPADVNAALLTLEWKKPPEHFTVTLTGRNGEMPPQAVVVAGGERCLAIVPKFHDVVSETDRYAEARHHHLAVRWKIRRRAGRQKCVVFALQFSPACTGLDITA